MLDMNQKIRKYGIESTVTLRNQGQGHRIEKMT